MCATCLDADCLPLVACKAPWMEDDPPSVLHAGERYAGERYGLPDPWAD